MVFGKIHGALGWKLYSIETEWTAGLLFVGPDNKFLCFALYSISNYQPQLQ